MAATPQFSDLTTVPSQVQVLNQEVLPQLASLGANVTSWILNGPYRTMAMAVAFCRMNARLALAALTAAGFEDYVFGRTPAPGGIDVTGWAPFVAKQRYGLKQKSATFTQRSFLLTNTSNTAYSNLQAGSIIVSFPSGNRYILQGNATTLTAAMGAADTSCSVVSTVGFPTTGTLLIDSEQMTYTGLTTTSFTGLTRAANGTTAAAHSQYASVTQVVTIPANGTVTTTFRSEFQMATGLSYNADPSGATISLVTSNYPGVTVTNIAPTYSQVSQVGGGIGTVTASGSPTGSHQVTVKITASGTVSGATVGWSTSVDGAAFVVQSGGSASNLGGVTGLNVTLNDNSGNPSFVSGTYYYFSTPGTDIVQTGNPIETPQALGQRCAGLWPLLAFTTDQFGNFVPPASPTQNAYIALALSQPNVAIAFSVQDATINNQVNLYVAGSGGAILSTGQVAAIQQFFNAFNMATDTVVVRSPTARVITLAFSAGSIQVKAAQLAAAQTSLQNALQAYLGGTDPAAALSVNGLIDYDYIISLIRRTQGVTHVTVGALTINGAAADLQLPVTAGAFEVASWTQQVASALPWSTV